MKEILIPITAILSVFGLPAIVILVAIVSVYKNKVARYRTIEQAINSNAESLARDWMSVRFIMRQVWISTGSRYDIAMACATGTKKVGNTFNSLVIEFEAV